MLKRNLITATQLTQLCYCSANQYYEIYICFITKEAHILKEILVLPDFITSQNFRLLSAYRSRDSMEKKLPSNGT